MTAKKKTGVTKSAPKNRATDISPARRVAFNILQAVELGQSHSDDLLRGKAVNALSDPDRNLATALVLGVLRWQILLDRQVQALLTRPNAKLDAEILIALRLGAFQLLHMDRIPARAAIDESVELAKQAGHRFASAMVNAVLRKLVKPGQADAVNSVLEKRDVPGFERDARQESALSVAEQAVGLKGHGFSRAANATVSERASAPEVNLPADLEAHPTWIVDRWISLYGLEAARAICHHGQSQPVLTVRIIEPDACDRPLVKDRGFPPIPQKEAEWMGHPNVESELAASGIHLEPGQLLTSVRTVISGDVTATEAFREGRVRFQDEGSQLVAELASRNPNQKARTILDACAAPGGKTLILAERNPQAHIVACESSAPRLEQLRKRLAFLGERVECRFADATNLTEEAAYGLVLADVPCSGTGTLGRNPEIRHRLRLEDLTRQADRQRAILTAALGVVRPGGHVVYSTCSLEPEENEQVVAAVLAATPNVRQVSFEARIGEMLSDGILTASGAKQLRTNLTPEGSLRLLPGAFHTDGFFIALLERQASAKLSSCIP